MSDIDSVRTTIDRDLDSAGLRAQIVIEERLLGGGVRLILERKLADHMRFLEVAPIASTAPRQAGLERMFAVRGDRARSANPNDNYTGGRLMGDLSYVRMVLRAWLIDLRAWETIPTSIDWDGSQP